MSAKLSNIVNTINKVKWSKTCEFTVVILPNNDGFKNLIRWGNPSEMQTSIDITLKDIVLPQYTASMNEELVAGEWHFSRAFNEVFVTTMTFRDFENASVYRRFVNAFIMSEGNYSDNTSFSIEVYLDEEKSIQVMGISDAQISSVSSLNLSQDNSEILEFTVEFRSNTPTHSNDGIKTIDTKDVVTGNQSVASGTNNMFSNAIRNGLSKAQNAVVGGFDNFLKSWT